MVKKLIHKIRPVRGFAHIFHVGFVAILPLIVFTLVRLELIGVALAVILLSKWRIFAVRPHHWPAHFRTNAVDVIFSLSMLAFMASTTAMSLQLLWVLVYEIWILYIKPGSSPFMVSAQALIAQAVGLTALFVAWEDASLAALIISTAAILYFSSRHFFNSFEEPAYNAYSWTWSLFGASLAWILGHWLLFYGPVAQLALLLTILGYGLAALYYLSETDKLSRPLQRQVVFIMIALVGVILNFSDWGSNGL